MCGNETPPRPQRRLIHVGLLPCAAAVGYAVGGQHVARRAAGRRAEKSAPKAESAVIEYRVRTIPHNGHVQHFALDCLSLQLRREEGRNSADVG